MDFNYTEEQLAIQDTLKKFIAKDYSFEYRTSLTKTDLGHSELAWKTFAELGLLSLPFSEEYDGLGGTAIDTMLVMEMLGKGLSLEPYISTVIISGGILQAFGSEKIKKDFLPKIGSGDLKISFAHHEPNSRYQLNTVNTVAKNINGSWIISGKKSVVLHAPSANYLLVSARNDGIVDSKEGITLFLIDTNTPGVKIRPYTTQDGARAADVELNNISVSNDSIIGSVGDAFPILNYGQDLANAALCAEAVGIMSSLNEITLEYLKTRKQFGTVIGKFQALQHRMADMILTTEQSRSLAILSAVAQSNPDNSKRTQETAIAKSYICKASRHIGQEAVQLHGGMGVTEELNVGHYFKRLTMISLTYGDYDYHLDKVSEALLNI